MSHVTALLPELRRIAPFTCAPIVARWLSRGDATKTSPGRDAVLRECFEFLGNDVPRAALSRSLEGDDDSAGNWINADSAYVIADAVTARVLAIGSLPIDANERAELAKPLRPLFGDAGFPLEVSASGRWQLRAPREARLPRFVHPHDVLGDDLAKHLPSGDNERQWRHLLNEAQIILHNSPVNARRTQRGEMPINSVWFWGAGGLPAWVRSTLSAFASSDPDVIALGKLAAVARIDAFSSEQCKHGDGRRILVDADDADRLVDYVDAIDRALDEKRIDELRLLSNDGTRAIYRRSNRLRFWRTIKPLQST